MPKGPKGEKRPADVSQLAKMMVDIASGETPVKEKAPRKVHKKKKVKKLT